LGISNGETIAHYVRAAKELQTADLSGSIDMLDKRSPVKKVIDKLFTPTVPLSRLGDGCQPKADGVRQGELIGRSKLISDITRDLSRGQSVLLIGSYGSGKTAILKSIVPEYTEESSSSIKSILINLAKNYSEKLSNKTSINELLEILKGQTNIIIPFDNIDIARKENLDVVLRALPNHAFLLTAEKITTKMQRIQQQVNTYYLNKLTDEDIKQIIDVWLSRIPIAENQKELLFNKILGLSNGNPGTAVHLLEKLARQPRVSENIIRELYIDQIEDTRDWSNLMLIGFSAIIALRYIARGTGDTELYILSGVVYAFFLALKTLGRGRSR
jgi:replication-associated recombination protein RarA